MSAFRSVAWGGLANAIVGGRSGTASICQSARTSPVDFHGEAARHLDRRFDRRVPGIDVLERLARNAEHQLGLARRVGEPRGEEAAGRNPDRRRGGRRGVGFAPVRLRSSRRNLGEDRRFAGIGGRRDPHFEGRLRGRGAAEKAGVTASRSRLPASGQGDRHGDDGDQGRGESQRHRIARRDLGAGSPALIFRVDSATRRLCSRQSASGIGVAETLGEVVLKRLQADDEAAR